MLDQLAFDNICHEHLTYYSYSTLNDLLLQNRFKIVDVKLNETNGGSFRIYAQKDVCESRFGSKPLQDVSDFRIRSISNYEETLKLTEKQTYINFFNRTTDLKIKLRDFINKEKKKNKTIWGYGASTKGNTLLQLFDLDSSDIEKIAEKQYQKFGLKTVGSNIPIVDEKEIYEEMPDYLLILPWHFVQGFINKEIEYLRRGGKFIVPCPEFKVISYADIR